ncbi:unnamed protein product [Orchesella dallaii]|uniref:Rho guanine nucleotide exchange factor 7 n=1 Tax=Orchesella dallaii TaxID=48710 RepID=A0ABP1R1D0_9HEXA
MSQMDTNGNNPLVVRATHQYNPVNNDELQISVGDVITVTNPEDGGWWEGTLGNQTGWFPSNYVVPIENTTLSASLNENQYKQVIVNEMLESEKKFVDDMNLFQQQVINKLVTLLPQDSLSTLQTHHGALIQAHQINVLSPLTQSTSSDSHQQQRIGKLFLTAAPQIQAAHKTYATFHPTAVQIVEKHKHTIDQWWTSNNQNEQSGVLKIITGLSAPFRRLDKYATLLQELQRMMEEYHRDRGDVQRSVAVFRDLEKTCRNLRKEKEMELEVLTPGAINDFEGAEVSSLGDIVLMSLVYVGKESTSRYFVLFSNTMLILSYDNSGNTFTYHGRIQVSGITVSDVPDSNGFEISGPTVHTMLVVCGSKSLKVRWMNALTDQLRASRSGYVSSEQHFGSLYPPVQAWNISRLRLTPPYNPFLQSNLRAADTKSISFNNKKISSINNTNNLNNEHDFAVLSIVDAFCVKHTDASPRHRSPTNEKQQRSKKTSWCCATVNNF